MATTPLKERDTMYEVKIKSLAGDKLILRTAKNEKSAVSVANYWLKKFDSQGIAAIANWSEITEQGVN